MTIIPKLNIYSPYRVFIMVQETEILNGSYTHTHMTFQRRWPIAVPSTIQSGQTNFHGFPSTLAESQNSGIQSRFNNYLGNFFGGGQQFIPPTPPQPPTPTFENLEGIPKYPKLDTDVFIKRGLSITT